MKTKRGTMHFFYSLIVFFNLIHFLKIDILCFKTSKLISKKIDSHHMEKMFPEIQKLFWKTGRSQPKDSKQK